VHYSAGKHGLHGRLTLRSVCARLIAAGVTLLEAAKEYSLLWNFYISYILLVLRKLCAMNREMCCILN